MRAYDAFKNANCEIIGTFDHTPWVLVKYDGKAEYVYAHKSHLVLTEVWYVNPQKEKEKPAERAVDAINPKHYTDNASGVECIQVAEHLSFNLGNAMKYIWRCGKKGPAIEDLEKSIWYLRREIARLTIESSH